MLDSNRVVFNLLNPGCTPGWYFDDGSQSTVNGVTKQYPVAGNYSVEVMMYNRNGICDGSVVKEFSFTETFLNFDSETAKLTGGSEAVWMIAKDEKAHLACGESADNPTGWWSAQPGDKNGTGLYDDQFIFKAPTPIMTLPTRQSPASGISSTVAQRSTSYSRPRPSSATSPPTHSGRSPNLSLNKCQPRR